MKLDAKCCYYRTDCTAVVGLARDDEPSDILVVSDHELFDKQASC